MQQPGIDRNRIPRGKQFVLLMSAWMFFILFLANVFRVLKESLLIAHMGVESLSYIRILLQLPLSLLIIYVLATLKKKYTQQRIFNSVLWFYFFFMVVFTNLLYPYMEVLSLPLYLKTYLLHVAPALNKFIPVVDFWPLTLLYLLADLWPLLIYVNCFWELSNRLVSTQEASKIYPLYNVLGQSNLFLTGFVLYYLSSFSIKHYISSLGFDFVRYVGNVAVLVIAIVLLLYNYVLANYDRFDRSDTAAKPKQRLSFTQTARLLWDNKHIANIFFCTLLYYAIICTIETLWFHSLAVHYTTSSLIGGYQSQTLLLIGASTLFFALIGRYLLQKWGWYGVLQTLPYTMLISSLGLMGVYGATLSPKSVWITLYLSTGMYVMAKSMKYTFFDVTKEMAYIPADEHLKFYGKLSADTLANSVGKVIGNVFPFLFFAIYWRRSFDGLAALCLSLLLVLLSSCWIYIAARLRVSYQDMLKIRPNQ